MEHIEEYKFLEGLKRSGFYSKYLVKNYLTEAFKNLTEKEAEKIIDSFICNYSYISTCLCFNIEPTSEERSAAWKAAYENLDYFEYLSAYPIGKNFSRDKLVKEFNISLEDAEDVLKNFALTYNEQWAIEVINSSLGEKSSFASQEIKEPPEFC